MDDPQAAYASHLRSQPKTLDSGASAAALACPYCSGARVFQSEKQLLDHAGLEHADKLSDFGSPDQARAWLREEGRRRSKPFLPDQFSEATAGSATTLELNDLTHLSLLEKTKAADTTFAPARPGRKRPAGSELHPAPMRQQDPTTRRPKMFDAQYAAASATPPHGHTSKEAKGGVASPYLLSTPNPSSEDWSVVANRSQYQFNPYPPTAQSQPGSRFPSKSPIHGSPYHQPTAPKHQPVAHTRQPSAMEAQRTDPRYPGLLLQPDSRPISQEQLASEVKSIYAGLTMVETKCIHVDRAQAAAVQEQHSNPKLANDHWQALIALHRTLLHEHHDFFLASQHPSASPALQRLAQKYSMPARMWKHGIYSFLELLRRRLPDSLDYMLAFIYLAYQMMALLYETVPAFEDTWIECLGDLGRYRMAIEDEDVRDREIWAGVARSWYTKAADKNPAVGRLYHHLAILARANALQQLYYYARSLTCVKPFASARESILTLLEPILGKGAAPYSHALPIDTYFIRAHAVLFEKLPAEQFDEALQTFQDQLDNHIGRVTAKWKEQGVYVAVTNIAALFDYGSETSILRQLLYLHAKAHGERAPMSRSSSPSDDELSRSSSPVDPEPTPTITESEVPSKRDELINDFTFSRARDFAFSTLKLVLRRIGDKNVLPHVHVLLSFLFSFASTPYVAPLIDHAPWTEIVALLNTLLKSETPEQLIPSSVFPSEKNDTRPLPEDYQIRGQVWSQWYFPQNWFRSDLEEEKRSMELASTMKSRIERVLCLGYQISSLGHWIKYDETSHMFSVIASTQDSAF